MIIYFGISDKTFPVKVEEGYESEEITPKPNKERNMLMVTIPNDEYFGQCRINGSECDYEISEDGKFHFKYKESKQWNKRQVCCAIPGAKGFTTLICDNGDSESIDITNEQLRELNTHE